MSERQKPSRVHSGEVSGHRTPKARQSSLIRQADRWDGAVSLGELYQLGFSEDEIRGMVRRGELIRVHRGVYALHRKSLTYRARLRAALLTSPDDAWLSHRTAATVYRARTDNPFQVHVTVPGGSHRDRDNLVFHRAAEPDPRDVRVERGLRVSTYPQMLVELSGAETAEEMMRLIRHGVRKGVLDLTEMEARLERSSRRPGAVLLASLCTRYFDPTDRSSGLEGEIEACIEADDRIPRPAYNVRIGNHEYDFVWLDLGVVLEADGRPWHWALEDMDNDNAKNIELQLRGLRYMRATDVAWCHDRAGVIENLLAMLELGRRSAA